MFALANKRTTLFFGQYSHYIKSSQLICTVNQLIGFYVTRALILSVFKYEKLIIPLVKSVYRMTVFLMDYSSLP